MKKSVFSMGLAVVFCGAMSGLASATGYSFRTVIFPNDTFTQLLGINDFDLIVGYAEFENGSTAQGFFFDGGQGHVFKPQIVSGDVGVALHF